MPDVAIHKTYFHWDDVCDGDIPQDDTESEDWSMEDIEWYADSHGDWADFDCTVWRPLPIAQAVAQILINEGLEEIGNATAFYHVDGSYIVDNYTGKRVEVSGHIHDFDDETAREIHRLIESGEERRRMYGKAA
ncbi:hypothetical protein ACFWY5_29755 [Nonomuraea sp. NPDC059007]|uniref:hypothetical protein n=1 Tax=Nonomuraea sp. NPDC059007 TaxID=3346692 RepID=UPI0036AB97B2